VAEPSLDLALFIDNLVVAFGYVWIACGLFLLPLAVIGGLFLARRPRPPYTPVHIPQPPRPAGPQAGATQPPPPPPVKPAASGGSQRVAARHRSNGGNGGNDNNAWNDGGPSTNDPLDDLVNQTNAAPEPATLLLVASGLAGVGALARRRRNAQKDRDA
jgi:hypothetical protein